MKKAILIGCAALGVAALGWAGLMAYTVHELTHLDLNSLEENENV